MALAALRRSARRAFATQPYFRSAGEGAVLMRFGTGIDEAVSERVLARLAALDASERPEGVLDVLPAYASLGILFDPTIVAREAVEAWCLSGADDAHASEPRTVEIPVKYDGPDLDAAAELAGLASGAEAAAAHAAGAYRVYFLGFTGGFPYLGGLGAALARVPRLATPRQLVPRGSVGVAAGQTGVYTRDTPGGWHLLGRTGAALFDPARDPPALLRPGDRVKFVASDAEPELQPSAPPDMPKPAHPWATVLAPGLQTTVQDLGREGHGRHGVSRAGAADEVALRAANAL
eukprot:CAMPEP_0119269950 /NCGR_PEP_ID=MMETSP1329-20130426/7142_1 /TAXON_ID=114041 /ORGANISM="Genus nov. species nov., Strain RCC1024" /LENGTH=290 /DNA_ID=CAMNT_0007269953 /DNA_START=140 /DNA_END=1009 /DNA_ORIENTATION=-